MPRHCIVEIATGVVVNIIDYASSTSGTPPGYSSSFEAIESTTGQIGWLWNGSIFTDPNPPDPGPSPDPGTTPPVLVSAAYNIVIANGDVSSIEGAFNLVAALYLDVGQYMLLFLEPQIDTEYVPQIIDGDMSIRVTEKATDYLMIEARDTGGVLADTAGFGLAVYRF